MFLRAVLPGKGPGLVPGSVCSGPNEVPPIGHQYGLSRHPCVDTVTSEAVVGVTRGLWRDGEACARGRKGCRAQGGAALRAQASKRVWSQSRPCSFSLN